MNLRGHQMDNFIYLMEMEILMNPEDAADHHFTQNEKVRLISKTGVFEGHILLASIARGNLQVHFPEGNVLIPRGIVDAGGGVPDYNTEVRVENTRSRRSG